MSAVRSVLLTAIIALVASTGCSEIRPDEIKSLSPGLTAEAGATQVASATSVDSATEVAGASPAGVKTSTLGASTTPAPTRTPRDPTASPTASPSSTATKTPTQTLVPTRTNTPTPRSTATPYPVPTGKITRIDAQFTSASLQTDREVIIYLPPGYSTQATRRYPVVYLLHGYGGFDKPHTTEWESWGLQNIVEEMILNGSIQPLIVAQPIAFMPDGQNSLFFNHGPGTDGKPWGDYIWRDVVSYIDSNYRTIASARSRAIAGYSFGGQGALSLAFLHPEIFAVVGGHSPSFRGADGSIGYINDWNYFNQFDPIWLVQNKTSARQLSIWMDVALGDDKVRDCGPGSDRCVESFHQLLLAKGVPHEWHDAWEGPHEGSYWMGHTPDYFKWYSSKLGQ